ncbi:hypothetical protein [Campylobacter ureolyticus]|nr:hypothetical protein [Campylobacter ureolyticus]MDU5325961.1 hypothetical protein [Campylobacter ureolyticus]
MKVDITILLLSKMNLINLKKMNLSYTKVNLPLLQKEYLFPKAI